MFNKHLLDMTGKDLIVLYFAIHFLSFVFATVVGAIALFLKSLTQ